jgi:hypothetical protein
VTLRLVANKPDHYTIRSGELDIGSLYLDRGGPHGPQWLWFISCLHVLPADGPTQGWERTREDAMAACAARWRKWVAQAGLREA